jgi:hypothetical protein
MENEQEKILEELLKEQTRKPAVKEIAKKIEEILFKLKGE